MVVEICGQGWYIAAMTAFAVFTVVFAGEVGDPRRRGPDSPIIRRGGGIVMAAVLAAAIAGGLLQHQATVAWEARTGYRHIRTRSERDYLVSREGAAYEVVRNGGYWVFVTK